MMLGNATGLYAYKARAMWCYNSLFWTVAPQTELQQTFYFQHLFSQAISIYTSFFRKLSLSEGGAHNDCIFYLSIHAYMLYSL